MAPLIMLEGLPASFARARSSEVVRGRTARVLLIVVATFLLIDGPGVMAGLTLPNNRISQHVGAFIWSTLTAPFGAHILTVVYYRLTDPARPVVHEDVERWASVWNEVA